MPVDLYDRAEELVKGRGKPSWGRLVAWTCQTQSKAVVDEALRQVRPYEGLIPRGQNKRGTAATQVTARRTPTEHKSFVAAREATAAANAANLPADAKLTATVIVIAALESRSGKRPRRRRQSGAT